MKNQVVYSWPIGSLTFTQEALSHLSVKNIIASLTHLYGQPEITDALDKV